MRIQGNPGSGKTFLVANALCERTHREKVRYTVHVVTLTTRAAHEWKRDIEQECARKSSVSAGDQLNLRDVCLAQLEGDARIPRCNVKTLMGLFLFDEKRDYPSCPGTIHSRALNYYHTHLEPWKAGKHTALLMKKGQYEAAWTVVNNARCLVLDEVSQIEHWVFDFLAIILGEVRTITHALYNPNDPFKGLRLVAIGDMMQMSPIPMATSSNVRALGGVGPLASDLATESRSFTSLPIAVLTFDARSTGEAFKSMRRQVAHGIASREVLEMILKGEQRYAELTNATTDADKRLWGRLYDQPKTLSDVRGPHAKSLVVVCSTNARVGFHGDERISRTRVVEELDESGSRAVGGPTLIIEPVQAGDGNDTTMSRDEKRLTARYTTCCRFKPGLVYMGTEGIRAACSKGIASWAQNEEPPYAKVGQPLHARSTRHARTLVEASHLPRLSTPPLPASPPQPSSNPTSPPPVRSSPVSIAPAPGRECYARARCRST